MRTKLIMALAVATVAAMAGCGGDDDTAAEAEAITKEEWITEANRICQTSEKTMEARAEEFFAGEEGSEADFQRTVVVPGISEQVAGVKALGAPVGDEDEVEAIIAAAEAGLEEARTDPEVVESDSGPLAEAGRLIGAYGATGCA